MPAALRAMLSMVAMNRQIARSFAPIRHMARGTGRLIVGVFRGAGHAVRFFLRMSMRARTFALILRMVLVFARFIGIAFRVAGWAVRIFLGLLRLVPRLFRRSGSSISGLLSALWRAAKPLIMIYRLATKATRPLQNMASQLLSLENIQSAMSISDRYMNSLARINAVNDGTQSDKQLQEKIYAAAYRSRGNYFEMTDYVARLGLTAPEAFSGNDEVIAFTELAQKAFRLGGTGAMEQQDGMTQLINAMATGGFQGEDFNAIMNSAPMLAEAISSFTGKSTDELKAMSAEGLITADIIKWALFNAADEINRKFEDLPMTFGDIGNQLSTVAIQSFGPVIEHVNQMMNSEQGQQFIARISQVIQVVAGLVGGLVEGIGMLANWVIENWSMIEPFLIAAGVVWLALITAQLWVMFAAWVALNMPMIVVVTVIALIIFALQKLGVTTEQIVGTILGAFSVLGAFLWNVIVGVVNSIIQFLWRNIVEKFIGMFEWAFNALNGGFNSFGDAVKNLIGQIISWFLSLGKIVTTIIDAIFGTEWTDGLTSLQDELISWGKNDQAITISREAPTFLNRIEYDKAWDAGYQTGEKLVNSIQNGLDGFNLEQMMNFGAGNGTDFTVPGDSDATLDNINKVNEVGRIGDTVDISSEDLKMMRELAEMNAIQNFVSLTPTVNVQTGDIRNGYDVDTIIARIEQSLTDQIASSAQGVYGLG